MGREDVPVGTRWRDDTPGYWEWDGKVVRATSFDEGPALMDCGIDLATMIRMESRGHFYRVPPPEAPGPKPSEATTASRGGAGLCMNWPEPRTPRVEVSVFPTKPLGHSSYGSIGHLPGSRMDHNHQKYGTGQIAGKDFGISEGQARICTVKARDKRDAVYVQEKLDGSNVGVANIDGVLVPMGRSGYPAVSSKYEQHKLFAGWVFGNADRFDFLKPGERVCGEWLAQAHGTIYNLTHGPFVAFDIMRRKQERVTFAEANDRIGDRFPRPFVVAMAPTSIERALEVLGDHGHHGSVDEVEGAVWRVERDGKVDFLAKYVRPSKVDGKYLPEKSGGEAVWNWRPVSGGTR